MHPLAGYGCAATLSLASVRCHLPSVVLGLLSSVLHEVEENEAEEKEEKEDRGGGGE